MSTIFTIRDKKVIKVIELIQIIISRVNLSDSEVFWDVLYFEYLGFVKINMLYRKLRFGICNKIKSEIRRNDQKQNL